jgi:hypothetical protein
MARPDDHHVTDLESRWLDLVGEESAFQSDSWRNQGEKGPKATPSARHCPTLQRFGDREEEREGRCFAILTERHCADCSDGHQGADTEATFSEVGQGSRNERPAADEQADSEETSGERILAAQADEEEPAGHDGQSHLENAPERYGLLVLPGG